MGETPATYGNQYGQTNPGFNTNGMDSMNGMNNNKMSTMNELVMLKQFNQMVREIVDEYLNENRSKSGNNIYNNNRLNRGQLKNGKRNTSPNF